MKKLNLAITSALLLASGASFAASISISPAASTALPGAGNVTTPTPHSVMWDPAGYAATAGDSIDALVNYDSTKLVASNFTGNCVGGAAGEIIIAAVNNLGNTIPAGSICGFTLTTTAGAALADVIAVDLNSVVVGTDGAADPVQPPLTDGTVTIANAPPTPPTITFNPNGGAVALTAPGGANQGTQSNVTTIDVTAVGGGGGGSGSYNCTGLPGNFTVTNASNPLIVAGSDPANMDVSCTLGAAQTNGTLTCTRTGAVATNVVFNVTCPAGVPVPTPILTANPLSGAALNCSGTPGATTTTQVNFQNTGTADVTGLACIVGGAGFTLSGVPAATLAPNAVTQAVVSCTVPADGVTINGTLDCDTTAPGTGPSYTLSSTGVVNQAPSQPETIPSTSLWAKIGLIGLLAGLGVLLVGFRRQH